MTLTNRSGFPEALVRAVEADPYNKGECDFSVTELLKPPRATALLQLHRSEVQEDVEDRLWSLYGQIAHLILERANEADLVEKRFSATFNGLNGPVVVSAQVDTLSLKDGVLTDWKFTTSWGFKVGQPVKPDWVAQLNMQLEILRRNNYDASIIRIVGLLRDWSKMEALRTQDYPKKGVVSAPVEIWSREQTTSFIEMNIARHQTARAAKEEDLPLCSPDERWAKPDQWAVMKGERAVRFGLQFTERAAKEMLAKTPGGRLEFRPGISTKCEHYCDVSQFCTQFKGSKK